MSSTLPPDGSTSTRDSVAEEFLALLLADDDLLRAEFDAIIAAQWSGPPPSLPDRRASDDRGPGGWPRPQLPTFRVIRPDRGTHDRSARQRSPPTVRRRRSTTTRKAGDGPPIIP